MLAALALLVAALLWPVPDAWLTPVEHRQVVDRHGVVLLERRVPDQGRAQWVTLDEVAPHVIDALIASEDQRFWVHPGVDPIAIVRAAHRNASAGRVVQGGSTLTQQATRLSLGRPPGLWGKLVEAHRALRMTLWVSKEEVLTQVLNRSWFGAGAAGVEAAASEIFDESAASLSVAEAAMLVGILPAPERLNPRVNLSAAIAARERVLQRMVAMGVLDQEVASAAAAEPVQLGRPIRPGLAPHLAVRLLSESPDTRIETTLDAELQRRVEDLAAGHLERIANRGVDHAAVLVVDLHTDEVRAWVGSGDWTAEEGAIDGVRTRRSPGSTLKPFVYGVYFEQGGRPSDVLPDLPVSYDTPHGTWTPGNYGGGTLGPVRAQVALASSLNLPAVHVLEQVGVSELHRRLTAAGVTLTAGPDTYGLGLALGDAEITMLDLATAYAGLAHGGVATTLRWQPGPAAPRGERFLDHEAVGLVRDSLSDPMARVPAFGRDGVLERSYEVAVKTGTSQGFRDNWTLGWTQDWLVAVWVGNFDARPMIHVSGVTGAAPLWASVMDELTGASSPRFEEPEAWQDHRVCGLSGARPTAHCPEVVVQPGPAGHKPGVACDWHAEDGVHWPARYAAWAASAGHRVWGPDRAGRGEPAIVWPADGAVVYLDPRAVDGDRSLRLQATAPANARQAIWRVNGTEVARVGPPFTGHWSRPSAGTHQISLEVDGVVVSTNRVTVSGG